MDNEIIVDNVDVSSCKSFCENYGEYHQGCWEDNEICYLHNNHCSDNKDCYYKQLLTEQANNKKLVEIIEKIRNYELQSLDIDWDEYEVQCRETDYSPIITYCEEGLGVFNGV